MYRSMNIKSLAVSVSALVLSTSVNAATVNYFSPSAFNSNTTTMNSALGISGYQIEDFEDTTLISGLTITQSFRNGSPDIVLTSTLPNVNFKFGSTQWDGDYTLTNTSDNGGSASPRAERTTFNFDPASSVGIGLAGFQSLNTPDYPVTEHLFFINGSQVGATLESLVSLSGFRLERNGYLRIDAGSGEVITSIGFENINTYSGEEDLLEFDHLAIQTSAVPVPAAVWLFGSGLIGLVGFARRKQSV